MCIYSIYCICINGNFIPICITMALRCPNHPSASDVEPWKNKPPGPDPRGPQPKGKD